MRVISRGFLWLHRFYRRPNLTHQHRIVATKATHGQIRRMADVNVENGAVKPTEPSESKVDALPKLSPAEFRIYNHMAENMDYFVCRLCRYSRKVRVLSRIQA